MKISEKSNRNNETASTPRAGGKAIGSSHKPKVQAMEKQITLKPRMSEKTYGLSLARNVYVFDVPGDASKQAVVSAVAAQFEVTVTNVNTTNLKGKTKRTIRKGIRPTIGKRSGFKKAYVTLKQGDTLPFFATEEEKDKKSAKKDDKKAVKAEKKVEKIDKKKKGDK